MPKTKLSPTWLAPYARDTHQVTFHGHGFMNGWGHCLACIQEVTHCPGQLWDVAKHCLDHRSADLHNLTAVKTFPQCLSQGNPLTLLRGEISQKGVSEPVSSDHAGYSRVSRAVRQRTNNHHIVLCGKTLAGLPKGNQESTGGLHNDFNLSWF